MRGGVGVLTRVKRAYLYSGEGTAAGALAGLALGDYIPFKYTVEHLDEGLKYLDEGRVGETNQLKQIFIFLAHTYKMFKDNIEAKTVLQRLNDQAKTKQSTETNTSKHCILNFVQNVSKKTFVSVINRLKSAIIIGVIGGTGGLVYGAVKNSETSTAAKIVRAIIYGMAATLPGAYVGSLAGNKGAILGATVAGTLGAVAGVRIILAAVVLAHPARKVTTGHEHNERYFMASERQALGRLQGRLQGNY
jgi:hypothetical protein